MTPENSSDEEDQESLHIREDSITTPKFEEVEDYRIDLEEPPAITLPESVMSITKEEFQQMIASAIAPLQTANSKLQNEISSLKSQISSSDPAPSSSQIKANIMREEKEAASRRVRERLQQADIQLDGDEFDATAHSRERIKTSDLDEFDGSDVYGFATSVESARSLFPSDSVASVMARNLRDMAKVWFQNLAQNKKEALLLSSEDFMTAIRAEFEVDRSVARQLARERKWNPNKESIMSYFYDKVKLVANSFGTSMNQEDQCHEIREGLPDDFKPFIRTPLGSKPTLEHLRKELKLLELDYISNKKKKNFTPNFVPNMPQQLAQPRVKNEGKTIAPPSFKGNRVSLKDSFDAKMIGQSPNPSNPRQMIRTYTIPDGSGRTLMLNRPCRTCGGNHFDFEPVHFNNSFGLYSNPIEIDSYPMSSTMTPSHNLYDSENDYQMMSSRDESYPVFNQSNYTISDEDYAFHMLRNDRRAIPPPSVRFEEDESSSESPGSSPIDSNALSKK